MGAGSKWWCSSSRLISCGRSGFLRAARAPVAGRDRLARWLEEVQRPLLIGRVPSERETADASRDAWNIATVGKRELALPADGLVELLEDLALCPGFAVEFHQAHFMERLLCDGSVFEGREDADRRRQYFRNQMLRLFLEKALCVRRAFDSLKSSDFDDRDVSWAAVINTIHPVDGALRGFARRVDVLLDSLEAPHLLAFGPADMFFVRLTRPSRNGKEVNAELLLASAERVVAPVGSRVNLLRLRLYPITAPMGSMAAADAEGMDCWIVPVDFLPIVAERQRAAVHALCNGASGFSEMVQMLIFGRLAIPPFRVAGEAGSSGSEDTVFGSIAPELNEGLNPDQRAAVFAAQERERSVTLIEGPPGTGKTHVAAAVVMAWLQDDPDLPILVATGTHTAKDLIAQRLQESGLILSTRKNVLLKKEQPMGAMPVFVETVYMAALPDTRMLPRVLIDESTQITEAAALVALGHGCSRLVLIGDSKQLGPVSTLGSFGFHDAQPHGNECKSFFEMTRERQQVVPIRLSVQYRMDPRICEYPSRRFYCGRLVNSASMAPGVLPQNFPFPNALTEEPHPVVFIDTSRLPGRCEDTVTLFGGTSLRNQLEASIICGVLRSMFGAGVAARDISVLTAYTAQRECLLQGIHPERVSRSRLWWQQRARRFMLRGADPMEEELHPRVHTIDGFQGCENDFVMFSAVRSNEEGRTGFVGDARRVCVLLTRARKGLVVVGDSSTLRNDEEWRCWLEGGCKKISLAPATAAELFRISSRSVTRKVS